jgi:hypothetical protein
MLLRRFVCYRLVAELVVVFVLIESVERADGVGAAVSLLEVFPSLAFLFLSMYGVTNVENFAQVDGAGRTEVLASRTG